MNKMTSTFNRSYTPDYEVARRSLIRAERHRLIKKGFIIPAYAMQPQLMVKGADGNWIPEIKTHHA